MRKLLMVSIAIMAAATNCAFYGAEKGAGKSITRVVELVNIDGLSQKTMGTLHIKQGNDEKLVIKGDDHIVRLIDTEESNGKLIIKKRFSMPILMPTGKLEFYLTVKSLKTIELKGSGDAFAEKLDTRDFSAIVKGSGSIVIDQLTVAKDLDVYATGSGDIEINNMDIKKTVSVRTSGSGCIELSSFSRCEKIESSISGSGGITLSGEVDMLRHEGTGSGQLDGSKLKATNADIILTGSGNARIDEIGNTVNAKLTGSGSLSFGGYPDLVKVSTSGSGRIKQN